MIKNFIFDWSGTISNDLPIVYASNMEILKHFSAPTMTLEEYRKESTLPYINFYTKRIKGITKKAVDELYPKLFLEIKKQASPIIYDGVKETLEELSSKEYRMSVLSSHIKDELVEEAKIYGIFNLFLSIYGDVFDKTVTIHDILKCNNFKPDETILVGDMAHDILAGRSAGVKTAAVTYGYHTKEILESYKPWILIDNFSQILRLV